jgi:nucleoside-diphosphate-sugar epimerase
MNDYRSSALIGATGFVGGNLLRQRDFDATFNSRNIDDIAGRSFDLLVCAGARAEKWKANADPEADLDNIEHLTRALTQVNVRKLVLISTVDVFVTPLAVDEDSPTPMTHLHAYGRNRRRLEQIVAGRFDVTIIRLPALYGPGLKKNVVHDLLHDHELYRIDSRGVFQFYDVTRLWSDVEIAVENDLSLVHLPTEPVSVADVAREAFGREFTNEVAATPARYDVHTRHAPLFGGTGLYIEPRDAELDGLRNYVMRERGASV